VKRAQLFPPALLVAAALLCGCGTYQLDLAPWDTLARRAPVGELAPLVFDLAEFADDRFDPLRVGYQKNAYGMNVFDVLTNRPVTGIFRDALAARLRANGHRVDSSGRFRIEAAVTFFWVEMQPALMGVTAVSTAACRLKIVDREEQRPIHEQDYTGHFTRPGSSAFEGAYREALGAALDRMIGQIAQDPALIATLRERTGPGPVAPQTGERRNRGSRGGRSPDG
jgi:hypothetical protein